MIAVTEYVEFMRIVPGSNVRAKAGNQVQIEGENGDVLGTEDSPLYVIALPSSNGSYVTQISPTLDPAVNYAAGDMIGAFINRPVADGEIVRLASVQVVDKAGQAPALVLYFFSALPNGAGATYTDNSPVVWGTGDHQKMVGIVTVATANYKTVAGVSVQTLSNIGQMQYAAAEDMYVMAMADGAYNAVLADDLMLILSWERM